MRKEGAMETKQQRTQGLLQIVAGLGIIVFAVVLVGVTTESDSPDWVSIVTAAAGLLLVLTGAYTMTRKRFTR